MGEQQDDTPPPRDAQYRIDGRSLRRTGRTLQLATRVSWEFDDKLRRIAQRDGLKLVEVWNGRLMRMKRQENS